MRRSSLLTVAVMLFLFSGSLSAMLRPPAPPPPSVPVLAPALPEVAGPGEYERMLAHVLHFEWSQAERVARRYVDLTDGRDRTSYVQGLLYRMRAQRITSLNDLATGTVECARCAGVSLHNLMLFFRHQGTPGWRKLGMPTRLVYERGLKVLPDDTLLAICRAGLLVDLGQTADAQRLFPHPYEDPAELVINDVLNMAYYWAARGDRERVTWWVQRGLERDPAYTRDWARDTDDLDAYRDDAALKALGLF